MVVQFEDIEKIATGDHYLIVEKHTSEEIIKAVGWKLKAAGTNCKVYPVQTSLECLLGNKSTSIQEVVLQILEFALPFIDYVSIGNTQELTEEKTAVLPGVTELPESVWMSEENLQLMADDERMLRGY